MKRILFTCLLAGAAFVSQAQTTQNHQCCSRESSIDLYINIESILCLIPECDRNGYVEYDCVDDFDGTKDFRQFPGGSPDYGFLVWSNRRFKVSTTADNSTFTRTTPAFPGTYQPFATGNVEWRVKTAGTLVGTALANPANYNTAWRTLTTSDASGDNTINDGPNGIHGFVLNFRTKPGSAWNAHPTQIMPGLYHNEVDVTASFD